MIRFRAVRQVKNPMFVIGQSSMDRIPLDPRFEVIGVGDIGDARENLRTIVKSRKIRKMALLHPSLEERRADLVKFQQKNLRHRRSQARSETIGICAGAAERLNTRS